VEETASETTAHGFVSIGSLNRKTEYIGFNGFYWDRIGISLAYSWDNEVSF
jgi:hypothetical protein